MDDGFGHWFAGLTDGEGCFYISSPSNWTGARFTIGLRADDWRVLDYAREQLGGIGVIRRRPSPKRHPTYNPAAVLTVWRPAELLQLVALFETFPLRAKKRNQFEVWRTVVHETAKGKFRDKTLIAECRAQLGTLRVYDEAAYDEIVETVRLRQSIRVENGQPPLCLCGCGQETGPITHGDTSPHPDNIRFNRFVRGHNRRLLFADLDMGVPPPCLCGCGNVTRPIASVNYKTLFHPENMHFRQFVNGHNRRGLRMPVTRTDQAQRLH